MYKEEGFFLEGEKTGEPIDRAKLIELVNSGALMADRRVRHWGSEKWLTVAEALAEPEELSQAVIPTVAEPETVPVEDMTDAAGWSRLPVAPWRRLAARTLDAYLHWSVASWLFFYALFSTVPETGFRLLAAMATPGGLLVTVIVATIVGFVLNALVMTVATTTVGKLIFGVKIRTPDLKPIGFGAALKREWDVLLYGCAMGVPIVSLFTTYSAFNRLKSSKETSWDEGSFVVLHRPTGDTQIILNITGILLILGLIWLV